MDFMKKLLDGAKVEWEPLGEVVNTITAPAKVKKETYCKKGKIPIIDQGIEFISGYTDENIKFIKTGEYIIFGDHSEHIKYVDFAFIQGADGLKILKTKSANTKYIYYAFVNFYQKELNYKRHWSSAKETLIPIPPLEIQEEIVRILDTFTELTAELTAELTDRKKQYEYYHNSLFDFRSKDVKYLSVGELFEIKNGLNKEKKAFGHGQPIINFKDVYNNRWLVSEKFSGLVDVDYKEIDRYSAKKGDVFFTRTSETKEDIGMSCTLIEEIPNCVFSGFVLRARPKTNLLLSKFLAYYFSTNEVRKIIVRYASFTTRATTTGPKLSRIQVPILPIEEQQRIVDILDNFDTLVSDIKRGLPREIELRQKQYEYYRNMLLSFPKDEISK